MSILRLTVSLIGITALAGCVASGNPWLRTETGASIQQEIKQGTTTELQVRAEFFNFFNHTNYGNPNNNVLSGGFGAITQTANGGLYTGREIQFALKVLF